MKEGFNLDLQVSALGSSYTFEKGFEKDSPTKKRYNLKGNIIIKKESAHPTRRPHKLI